MGPTVKGSETLMRILSLITHIIRPTFAFCEFSASEAKGCLQAIQRVIMVGNWLAKTARIELARFREFMGWLRYGENNCGWTRTSQLISVDCASGSRCRDRKECASVRFTGSHAASVRYHASERVYDVRPCGERSRQVVYGTSTKVFVGRAGERRGGER